MDEEQFNDLKQFIAATVSQSEARLRDELSEGLKQVRQEMKAGFAGVADTIEQATNAQLDDHERRITKLEKQAA